MGTGEAAPRKIKLLQYILVELKKLRTNIINNIPTLAEGQIIIGGTTGNVAMDFTDEIDLMIEMDDGMDYILVPNNHIKSTIISANFYTDAGTVDVTISNNGTDVTGLDPAAVTSANTSFVATAVTAFAVDSYLQLNVANLVGSGMLYGSIKFKIIP